MESMFGKDMEGVDAPELATTCNLRVVYLTVMNQLAMSTLQGSFPVTHFVKGCCKNACLLLTMCPKVCCIERHHQKYLWCLGPDSCLG
jgi:hypothetical protein